MKTKTNWLDEVIIEPDWPVEAPEGVDQGQAEEDQKDEPVKDLGEMAPLLADDESPLLLLPLLQLDVGEQGAPVLA